MYFTTMQLLRHVNAVVNMRLQKKLSNVLAPGRQLLLQVCYKKQKTKI